MILFNYIFIYVKPKPNIASVAVNVVSKPLLTPVVPSLSYVFALLAVSTNLIAVSEDGSIEGLEAGNFLNSVVTSNVLSLIALAVVESFFNKLSKPVVISTTSDKLKPVVLSATLPFCSVVKCFSSYIMFKFK